MARDGYLILDSDLHFNEPDDLWARYLDEPHRTNAPRFFGERQQPLVRLDAQAEALLRHVGATHVHITLSHTETVAMAVAALVRA